MTRFASKFGTAAALTLGLAMTAAAQNPKTLPKTGVPVVKETSTGEVVPPRVDTITVYRTDTVRVFRTDTMRLTGPTITRWDTVSVETLPGWMNAGKGLYFGLGAGSYYPSGGLGGGQIPGYAFQANLGVDPAGSPFGFRVTAGLARPDEAANAGAVGGRPEVVNFTGDLKLTLPIFKGTTFPMFSLYGVGGGALVNYKDLRMETDPGKVVTLQDRGWHTKFGYNLGGGAQLQLGHKRQLFLETRVINWSQTGYESGHQLPVILGLNWY